MNTIKNITSSVLILVGFIFMINAYKCFMTVDVNIRLYIVKYAITGLLMIGIGIIIKEFINLGGN